MTKAPRVVSLVPSVTETLLAWDVVPVAVTRFCEAPGVLTVGGTKNPDLAAIQALTPDLVVMDKEENRLGDAEWLEANGMVLHVTHVRTLDDVEPTLTALARAVGRSAEVPSPAPPGLQTALQTTPPDVERVRRLGTDMAAAVDVDQRRHVRFVDPGRGRDRQRVRGRG